MSAFGGLILFVSYLTGITILHCLVSSVLKLSFYIFFLFLGRRGYFRREGKVSLYYLILIENGNVSSYVQSHIWNNRFLKINLPIKIKISAFFTGQTIHSCVGSPGSILCCLIVFSSFYSPELFNYLPLSWLKQP